jgi:hypothetical protein
MNQITSRRSLTAGVSALCLAGLLTGMTARAQTLPRSEAEFEQEIGITAAQKAKLNAISVKYRPKMQAIAKKYQPQALALQTQMSELQKKFNAEAQPIRIAQKNEADAVYTPAQREKLKKLSALVAAQQGMVPGGTPPALPPHASK